MDKHFKVVRIGDDEKASAGRAIMDYRRVYGIESDLTRIMVLGEAGSKRAFDTAFEEVAIIWCTNTFGPANGVDWNYDKAYRAIGINKRSFRRAFEAQWNPVFHEE